MSRRPRGGVDAAATRELVRERYAEIAGEKKGGSAEVGPPGGCGGTSDCCDRSSGTVCHIGYAASDLASLPSGADLGLGCGNPTALLTLRPGQVVLDLGCGGGIDCFLAAQRVGPTGRAIGVDMTPEMLAKARDNARRGGYSNVEFRLGEIEHLPVADASVDVVVSNCVINLVPDKSAVYREAFRVLRPGGRLAVSDVVATRRLSRQERGDRLLWSSCSSGALEVGEVRRRLRDAGFWDVRVELRRATNSTLSRAGPASLGVVPTDIRATRP